MSTDTTTFDAEMVGTTPVSQTDAARNRLVIALLLGSTFVVFLNETMMSAAIPALMDSLGVLPNVAQWLTAAFLLTMAIVIPITGFLLQRLNTRPVFMLAMSIFTRRVRAPSGNSPAFIRATRSGFAMYARPNAAASIRPASTSRCAFSSV